MTNAYQRKKQPEVVRRALLDCAASLASEQGVGAVTVQAVADAAGVTKGGFFHHFPSKQALVEAVLNDLMEQFEAEIDAAMAKDPVVHGRFTRAYVEVSLKALADGRSGEYAALYVALLSDPELGRMCAERFARYHARYHAIDNDPILEIVRLAADGAWFAVLDRPANVPALDLPALRDRLVAMTRTA